MANCINTSLPRVEGGPHGGDMNNNTWTSNNNSSDARSELDYNTQIAFVLVLCIGIIGLVGNGIVIYLLGFRIKRSFFTTYILNLAVADFGVLLFGSLFYFFYGIDNPIVDEIHTELFEFMYTASQLVLTAISIDRCVCVLFPIWHQCSRPQHLSIFVCTQMWLLSVSAIGFKIFRYIAVTVLCLPLIIVSTMILLFKVCCKSQQLRRERLLAIILLTLFFYLIFASPLNVIFTVNYCTGLKYGDIVPYGVLCASLNSCANPVIYFMVGRKKRGQRRQTLKVILQRAFQEEEEHIDKEGTTAQMSP